MTIHTAFTGSPRAVAITPDGSRAYVTSYGPDTVSVIDTGTNTVVKDKDEFTFGKNIKVKALHTPCHTQDSICFYLQDEQGKKGVFTG